MISVTDLSHLWLQGYMQKYKHANSKIFTILCHWTKTSILYTRLYRDRTTRYPATWVSFPITGQEVYLTCSKAAPALWHPVLSVLPRVPFLLLCTVYLNTPNSPSNSVCLVWSSNTSVPRALEKSARRHTLSYHDMKGTSPPWWPLCFISYFFQLRSWGKNSMHPGRDRKGNRWQDTAAPRQGLILCVCVCVCVCVCINKIYKCVYIFISLYLCPYLYLSVSITEKKRKTERPWHQYLTKYPNERTLSHLGDNKVKKKKNQEMENQVHLIS